MNPSGLTKDDKTKIKTILDLVEAEPSSIEFLEPVDYIGILYT